MGSLGSLKALLVVGISLSVGVGCYEHQAAGGDPDLDGGLEVDGEADVDAADPVGCGRRLQPCCEEGCEASLLCLSIPHISDVPTCFGTCSEGVGCDFGGEPGTCQATTDDDSICVGDAPIPSGCSSDEVCSTEYGVDDNTYCAEHQETHQTFCFERCCLAEEDCAFVSDGSSRLCVPSEVR